ncbi:MAG: glycosyltransferase [Chitinophagaceae bacterium]|nr:glycosyltransferase [Chitinophagaceae bacterium]
MTVSIIVINFNTFEITCNCIRSVIDNAINFTYEIILVDNFSTECNPAMFKEKFPSVKLITNKSNSGFAEGNNLGISNASGTYILLLNSDTFLTENSIKKCLAVFNKNKDIAVLGCRMVYPNGEVQHSARRFRTINWEILIC